ncbi:MAG TPA: carbohydrate ABC transporter permease [Candidatus Limnocylindrales bacterium]|jgi:multiple sugar transport system permease protein|nr:carbohydrate ABC transporter permease [Candidatus Limnocylindrales bacterium]
MATTTPREADRSVVPGVDRPAAVSERPEQWRSWIGKIGFLLLLLFFTILFLYPMIWLLSASLKPGAEVFSGDLIGSRIAWENYERLFSIMPVALWGWNSLYTSFLAAITVTFSSALVAFAFAYFRFPGRNLVFAIVLASMMLPGAVTMIPTFLIWDALGFNNTHVPLWAGNLFASPFYIFLLRQFFLSLPRDLFDAAKVDGAGYLRMWWSVALPLTRAALIVVFVFELKAAWTDLVRPLIFLRDVPLFTLPRGLKAVIDSPSIGGERHFELLAVGGVIVMVPMVIVFFLGQRYFLEGIATSGSTGR